MGTTACGKSTVGKALASALDASFLEGDDYHSTVNKAKMASGTPLTDEDRWPWLSSLAGKMQAESGCVVVSCSALKKSYRDYITTQAREPVLYIYLHGDSALLQSRLDAREDHFMSKTLLQSQLQTLEVPDESEFSIKVPIDQSVDNILGNILDKLCSS